MSGRLWDGQAAGSACMFAKRSTACDTASRTVPGGVMLQTLDPMPALVATHCRFGVSQPCGDHARLTRGILCLVRAFCLAGRRLGSPGDPRVLSVMKPCARSIC